MLILLIIYIKNGKKGQLTIYKIILLSMCLLDSLCNIIVDPSLYNINKTLCTITGTLKLSLHFAQLSTQVVLLFITYFSFQHSLFIDKHSILFRLIIFIIWFLPIIFSAFFEFFKFSINVDKDRSFFCLATIDIPMFISIQFLINYILFPIFLCKLYRSLKDYSNNILYQSDIIQKYQKYLKNYIYGYLFLLGDIIMFIHKLIIEILEYIDFDFVQELEKNKVYEAFISIIGGIYIIDIGLSPIIIVIIYCFTKEHIKYMREIFCCKKEDTINITKATAFLFETSVVTVNNNESSTITTNVDRYVVDDYCILDN